MEKFNKYSSQKERSRKKKTQEIALKVSKVCGVLIVVGVLLLIYLVSNASTRSLFTSYDPISDSEYDSYENIIDSTEKAYLGFDKLKTEFKNPEIGTSIADRIIKYADIVKSESELVSYKDGSYKAKNNQATFAFYIDKAKYMAVVETNEDSSYKLAINNYNGVVYEYDSSKLNKPTRKSNTLLTKHLPTSLENDNGPIGVRSTDSKELQVIVNSCGKQEIKDQAIESVKNWLKSIDYNPEDFTYTADDYCDE